MKDNGYLFHAAAVPARLDGLVKNSGSFRPRFAPRGSTGAGSAYCHSCGTLVGDLMYMGKSPEYPRGAVIGWAKGTCKDCGRSIDWRDARVHLQKPTTVREILEDQLSASTDACFVLATPFGTVTLMAWEARALLENDSRKAYLDRIDPGKGPFITAGELLAMEVPESHGITEPAQSFRTDGSPLYRSRVAEPGAAT